MRSHLKLSLIVAIAVFPTQVFAALGSDPMTIGINAANAIVAKHDAEVLAADKASGKKLPKQFLNLDDAPQAIRGFKVVRDGDAFVMKGTISSNCKPFFEFSNLPESGQFSIQLKSGTPSECKKGASLVTEENVVALSGLPETRMTPTKSVASIELLSRDLLSDGDEKSEVLVKDADGKAVGFTSAADLAAQKKKDDAEAQAKAIADATEVLSTCGHDLTELKIGDKIFDQIAKVASTTWDKDAAREDLDSKWIAKCELHFKKSSVKFFDYSEPKGGQDTKDCDGNLLKIAKNSPKRTEEVKNLFLAKLNRIANASSGISAEKGLNVGKDALKFLDDNAKVLKLSDADRAKMNKAEDALYPSMIAIAAKDASDPEAVEKMKAEYMGFIQDINGSCLAEGTTLVKNERHPNGVPVAGLVLASDQKTNPECFSASKAALAFNTKVVEAKDTQNDTKQLALVKEQQAKEAAQYDSCQMMKAMGNEPTAGCVALDARVAAVQAQADAKAKAQANAGLTTNGFADAVKNTSATTSTLQGGLVDPDAKNVGGLPATTAQQPAAQLQQHVSAPVAAAPVGPRYR